MITVDNQRLLSVGSFEKLMNIGIIYMHGINEVRRLKLLGIPYVNECDFFICYWLVRFGWCKFKIHKVLQFD